MDARTASSRRWPDLVPFVYALSEAATGMATRDALGDTMSLPRPGYSAQPQGGTTTLPRLDDGLPDLEDLVILVGNELTIPVIAHGWLNRCPDCGKDHGLGYWWTGEKAGPLAAQPARMRDWAVMHQGEPLATGRQRIGWPAYTESEKLALTVQASL